MANIIRMTAGDTAPARVFNLKINGTAVDVTGATVKFKIKNDTTGSRTNDAANTCVLTTPTAGVVTYNFLTGDVPSEGTYTCDLEVTYATGKIQTFGHPVIVADAEA